MTGRADTTKTTIRSTIASAALSAVALLVAAVSVFLVVMWGASAKQPATVALGILLPIAITLTAAAVLAAHFVRLRLARAAAVRRDLEQELQTILRTDAA